MIDDPGDVTGGVLQEVHEIGTETGLHDAEHQQVRELRREDAVQRVRTVVPALAEPHTVAARRVEAEPAVLIGGDLEAGGENDEIEFIFLAVDDRTCRRDPLDALAVGVDQVHMRKVEGRQVLVVEGDAFAVLAVPRLELLGGRWVVDDLVDSRPDLLHDLEVDDVEFHSVLRR